MRVKICGMIRAKDVEAALNQGADAIGFVVGTPTSRRNLQLDVARKLIRKVPVFASTVVVTSARNPKILHKIMTRLHPDSLQIHRYGLENIHAVRSETPKINLILATPIRDLNSISQAEKIVEYSDAVLADSPSKSGIGGTGRVHDWKLTAKLRNKIHPHPLILAGGLTAANVRSAIREVRPYAVDVSSGVESQFGVKDHEKMKEFIRRAKET